MTDIHVSQGDDIGDPCWRNTKKMLYMIDLER